MAIKHRRGKAADFNASKLKSGEIAVCEDTAEVYVKAGEKTIELTGSDHTHDIEDINGLQNALNSSSSGGASNVVVDDESEITSNTLLYIDPTAEPDRLPKRFYGTAITGTGSGISTSISGAAPSDEYMNISTGYLYVMNAGRTWDYKSSLKGASGATGRQGRQGVPGTDVYHGVKYIGHRGLSKIAPENTIPAFVAAGTHGMWGAECDIWETADGEFIVCHNATVDAATNGTGEISSKTLAQLKDLTVDAWNNIAQYPNLKLPTLEEFLDCCKLYGIVPVVEIKNMSDGAVPNFIEIVKNKGFENTAVVISFDHSTLDLIRTISNVNMQYIFDKDDFTTSNYQSNIDMIAAVGNADLDINYNAATAEAINYAHAKGIRVNVWTVDDPTIAGELLNMGVDFISTNILLESLTLPQRPMEQICINSSGEVSSRLTSELALGASTAAVETASNTDTYFFNGTTDVLSINAASGGGIHCNFGCKIGDVISVEYECYAFDNIPKLTIGRYVLNPATVYGAYNFHGSWKSVRMALPVATEGSIDVDIGGATGIYRLKNISIRHIKYFTPADTSAEAQEWITASLESPAIHFPDAPVQYCKRDGIVYIRGWFKKWDKNSLSAANKLFTLPVGYRPAHEMNYTVPLSGYGTNDTAYVGRVLITTSGEVSFGAESVNEQMAVGCSACIPPFVASKESDMDSATFIGDSFKQLQIICSDLYGKKFLMAGDSYIYGYTLGTQYTWAYLLAQKYSCNYFMHGIDGRGLVYSTTAKPSLVNEYSDWDSDMDYIGVVGGRNDYNNNYPIGTNTDTTDATFKGGLNLLCEGLQKKYPGKKIFFMTPWCYSSSQNSAGAVQKDYADAIEEICALHSIPCFNSYKEAGVNMNISEFRAKYCQTSGDVSHFNAKGHAWFLPRIEKWILTL